MNAGVWILPLLMLMNAMTLRIDASTSVPTMLSASESVFIPEYSDSAINNRSEISSTITGPNLNYSGSSESYSTAYHATQDGSTALPWSRQGLMNSTFSIMQTPIHTFSLTSKSSSYISSYISSTTIPSYRISFSKVLPSQTQTPSLHTTLGDLSVSPSSAMKTSNLSTIITATLVSKPSYSLKITTFVLLATNLSSPIVSPSTSVVPSCIGCSVKKKDNELKYMILGVSIGAAFVIFCVTMAVAICNFKRRARRPSRNYARDDVFSPEKASDELLEAKESMFNSSTLQMGGGVINNGLEMDDGFLRIQPSTSSAEGGNQSKSTSFCPPDSKQSEPVTVHVNMEQVDPPTAESSYEASLRLLQDWEEELYDNRSDKFRHLKSDVENSVRDIYKDEERFKGVEVQRFREGSIIADISLIFLTTVETPLDILEKSVSNGKIGHLKVDKDFSVARGNDRNDIPGDASNFDKRQPYMQRILSHIEKRNGIKNSDADYDNKITLKSFQSPTSDGPAIRSEATIETTQFENIRHDASENRHEARRIVSSGDETNTDSVDIAQRPTSLVDLGNLESSRLRNQRDSGIGSMQELTRLGNTKFSNRASNIEDTEQVFYDIPETCDGIETVGKEKSQLQPLAEQGRTYVALYDFAGKDYRELSIRQGELLDVTQFDSFGWVKVMNSENQRGWVPTTFLVHVNQSQLTSTQETVETLEFLDNVLDQLDDESESGASAASTPVVEEYLKPVDNGENNHEYVSLLPESESLVQVCRCKSVYDFIANDSTEMTIMKGEIIDVLKTTDVGWWKGRIGVKEGWFPSSYVLPLHEDYTEVQSSIEEERISKDSNMLENEEQSTAKTLQYDAKTEFPEEKAIYAEPEAVVERKEHKYESLKKPFMPSENYANLYLQILKRESKNEEQMKNELEQARLKKTISDPERPLRVAPIPPREDLREKPAVPKRHRTKKPFPEKSKFEESAKPKPSSTHGEPPQRPVPPPPTAKPLIMYKSSVQSEACSDVIFIAKEVPGRTSATGKTSYENLPEKPRHSPQFIKRENVMHPIEAVSLNNIIEDTSSAVNDKEAVQDSLTTACSMDEVVAMKPSPPTKPSLQVKNSSTVSPTVITKSGAKATNELKDSAPNRPLSPAEVKPSKPLPKLDRQNLVNSEISTNPATSRQTEVATTRVSASQTLSQVPDDVKALNSAIKSSDSAREGCPPPTTSKPNQVTKPAAPTKPVPKLINEDIVNVRKQTSDQFYSNAKAGSDVSTAQEAVPAKPPSYSSIGKVDAKEMDLKDKSPLKIPSKSLPACEDSEKSTNLPKYSKPARPTKPEGFFIRKDELLSKKRDLDHNELSKFITNGNSEFGTHGNSFKLSHLVNVQGKKTPPVPVKRREVNDNATQSKIDALSEKPTPPSKPGRKFVIGDDRKPPIKESSNSPEIARPVPAQRVIKNKQLSKDLGEDSCSTSVKNSNSDQKARKFTDHKKSSNGNKVLQNNPVPPPRMAVPSSQDVTAKTKPKRPTSPPSHPASPPAQPGGQHEKPARPPLPSMTQSQKPSSPSSVAKDISKLRKVIKSYSRSSNKELSLVVGGMLFELAVENDRCYGLLENGEEGWYPSDHVVAVDNANKS